MANQHKQKLRGVRGVDDQLWKDFETAAARTDSDRSAILRRYIEWYVGRPDADLPERPEPPAAPPAD
ncbi:hypothetical protein ACWCQP_47100 [Streptomyces chartreusis]